jgi:hypothetical protein
MMVAPMGALAGSSRHDNRDSRDRHHYDGDRDHRGHHGKYKKYGKRGRDHARHDSRRHYDRSDRHDRHDRYDRGDRHRHGNSRYHHKRHCNRVHPRRSHQAWYGHRDDYRHARHDYRHDRRHYKNDRYYCKPCNSYFDSRDRFHSHLSGVHFLALWQLPFVILKHALGWAYYG